MALPLIPSVIGIELIVNILEVTALGGGLSLKSCFKSCELCGVGRLHLGVKSLNSGVDSVRSGLIGVVGAVGRADAGKHLGMVGVAVNKRIACAQSALIRRPFCGSVEIICALSVCIHNSAEQAGQTLREKSDAVLRTRSAAQQLRQQLEDAPKIDVQADLDAQTQAQTQRREKLAQKEGADGRIAANAAALSGLRRQLAALTALESRYAWVRALADTAGGTVRGKAKLSLEAYVQTTYFEQIIRRANLRLTVMTDGQYELKRRAEAENRQSQSGLELDVIDHCNGSERSVKSLSGGESFLASLALALGLSDVIQSSAGGVRLDTMFVDEGFGSLDDQALNQAMKALLTLTEGDRLVGIISHVSDLKQRIDRQIVVTKTLTGSAARIVQ